MVIATPFVLLVAWGISAAADSEPSNIGHLLLFVVPALLLIWHGVLVWRR